MTKTTTKTQTKCLKHPTYVLFLKTWWLTHSQYDDRYLTLVIMFTPVTLVTLVNLFRSYNQFYRAKCITVLGSSFWHWKSEDQFKNTLYILKPLVELQKELTITSSNMALLGKTGPFQEQHFKMQYASLASSSHLIYSDSAPHNFILKFCYERDLIFFSPGLRLRFPITNSLLKQGWHESPLYSSLSPHHSVKLTPTSSPLSFNRL